MRSRAATDAIKFTVDMEKVLADKKVDSENMRVNTTDDKENNLGKRNSDDLGKDEGSNQKKKLKTISLDDYQDEECINCGS